jgi:MFS family permease
MLLVGVGTSVIQQAVGIDAIQYYLIQVLEHSGIQSDKGQLGALILLGLVKLSFVFVGGKLFDSHGRRPLFVFSLLGTYVFLLTMFHQLSRLSSNQHMAHPKQDVQHRW